MISCGCVHKGLTKKLCRNVATIFTSVSHVAANSTSHLDLEEDSR